MRTAAVRLIATAGCALVAGGTLAACGGDDDRNEARTETRARAATTTATTPTTSTSATTVATTTSAAGTTSTTGTTTTAAPAARRTTVEGQPIGTLEPSPLLQVGPLARYDEAFATPRFFGPQSPWNVTVEGMATDPRSRELLEAAARRSGVIEVPGQAVARTEARRITNGIAVNTQAWTVPVVTETGGQDTLVWCRQIDCGPDAVGVTSLTVPAGVDPDPRYDGWFTVVDSRSGVAHDLWRARRQRDDSISFQYIKRWSLSNTGFSPAYTVSARGSGLPLFAGLVTASELEAGSVDHALAISVPGPAQGNFVAPASATDGIGAVDSLPEGARLRLREDFRLPSGLLSARGREGDARERILRRRRATEALVVALQRYGAIVVDRSRVPTLYAQRDISARSLRGDELAAIQLDDFEVVPLGDRLDYPRPATEQTDARPLQTPTAVPTGGTP